MIIYFSGTGNSRAVARELQRHIGGELLELIGERLRNPAADVIEVPAGESVVWVFPIYGWSVPPVVADFIRRCRMRGAHGVNHFLLCTCGDEIGRADDVWRNLIGRRGWNPRTVFSVQMPNTYVCMKGFDTDPAELERQKVEAMPERVAQFVAKMRTAPADSYVVRGPWAWARTNIVFPLFKAIYMTPQPFRSTDRCITCGLCARECPMDNITMADGRPVWGNRCAMCLRCYHHCPTCAIEWGDATRGKGHYTAVPTADEKPSATDL